VLYNDSNYFLMRWLNIPKFWRIFTFLSDTVLRCLSQHNVNYPTKHNLTDLVYWSLFHTATCFGCPDQPSSHRCRIHKKTQKESPFLRMVRIITILIPQRLVVTLKWSTPVVLPVLKPLCLQINCTPLSGP